MPSRVGVTAGVFEAQLATPWQRRRPQLQANGPGHRYATTQGFHEGVTEADDMDWDDVVDVVSVGSGAAGLAAALAAHRLGLSACVVGTGRAMVDDLAGRLGVTDAETVEYLTSVTDDIAPAGEARATPELPIRYVDGPARPDIDRPTGAFTFVGASLRTWAATCLASPCGLLATAVADPRLTVSYRSAGQTVEALVVGTVEFDGEHVGLDEWLSALAAEKGVTVNAANTLQRFVFGAGQVVGAIVDTPSGPRALRARYGAVMTLGAGEQDCRWPASGLDGVSTAEVAVVTRAASRFGRLELLVRDPQR